MTKHLVVVTCEDSGSQALYVNGSCVFQDDTVYACDIAEHSGDCLVLFSHETVVMPGDADKFPERLDQCMLWSQAGEDKQGSDSQ